LKTASIQSPWGASRWKLFLALSRTPHGLLDLAAPAMSALLWLGGFPSIEVLALGLITAFSGYTAVYALNDVVDRRVDKEKMQGSVVPRAPKDLDSVFVRHPLAQGMLSPREGLFWTLAWAVLALMGTYLLRPTCSIIFSLACLLEYSYCRLLKISYFRGIISGLVKTSGPLAAVFAVDPKPDPGFLAALFAWLFLWEIGGQNVPNDFSDMEEDRKIGAKTIPVKFGAQGSILIIVTSLFLVLGLSLVVIWVAPKGLNLANLLGALLSGIYFLLIPGYRLFQSRNPQDAFILFNRASYYPLAILLTTVIGWFF
jgi:4-hydroxybenzoate polyprenyltransferase